MKIKKKTKKMLPNGKDSPNLKSKTLWKFKEMTHSLVGFQQDDRDSIDCDRFIQRKRIDTSGRNFQLLTHKVWGDLKQMKRQQQRVHQVSSYRKNSLTHTHTGQVFHLVHVIIGWWLKYIINNHPHTCTCNYTQAVVISLLRDTIETV